VTGEPRRSRRHRATLPVWILDSRSCSLRSCVNLAAITTTKIQGPQRPADLEQLSPPRRRTMHKIQIRASSQRVDCSMATEAQEPGPTTGAQRNTPRPRAHKIYAAFTGSQEPDPRPRRTRSTPWQWARGSSGGNAGRQSAEEPTTARPSCEPLRRPPVTHSTKTVPDAPPTARVDASRQGNQPRTNPNPTRSWRAARQARTLRRTNLKPTRNRRARLAGENPATDEARSRREPTERATASLARTGRPAPPRREKPAPDEGCQARIGCGRTVRPAKGRQGGVTLAVRYEGFQEVGPAARQESRKGQAP
jgi:hypothetical protein